MTATASSGAVTVTYTNVAPTDTQIVSISSPLQEETAINVTGSTFDPATTDTLTYAWNVYKNGNTTPFATDSGINHTGFSFTPDDNGSYQIVLTVTDDEGSSSLASQTISVANVPPTLALAGNSSVNEGATYTLTLTGSDPADDTIASCQVTWAAGIVETVTAVYTGSGEQRSDVQQWDGQVGDDDDTDSRLSRRAERLHH